MVKSVLQSIHDLPTGGHFGVDKTIQKTKLLVCWPTLSEDVKTWINQSAACQKKIQDLKDSTVA